MPSIIRDASSAGKTPRAGKGASRPRLIWGIGWEYKLLEGSSGSGPVGGGEGGGSSSRKRGRGLGTMNSEEDMIENSECEGEGPRRSSGEGVKRERATGERNGLDSEDADMGGALRRMEGSGEADVGGGFELSMEVKGSDIVGRWGRLSEVTEISEGFGSRMGNVLSDGLKRVEGVKRTPCGRGAAGAADNCSFEEPGDSV